MPGQGKRRKNVKFRDSARSCTYCGGAHDLDDCSALDKVQNKIKTARARKRADGLAHQMEGIHLTQSYETDSEDESCMHVFTSN